MFWSSRTDRAKDPLTVLPAEIAEMILSYLDFRQVVSLIRVSSKWQECLISMPILWKSLDFSVAKASISPSAIQKYLGFSKGNATKDPLLEQLTEIRELTLDNWSSSTNIPTPGKIEMDQLHHLRLRNFFGGGVSLQSLPRLRFLQLDGGYSLIRQPSIEDPEPDPRISGLVELLVPRATFKADELMRILGPNTGDLRRLSLPHAVWLEEADLDILVRSGMLDPILDLDLSGTKVTDEVIESLAPRARQLRSIRLGSTRITGISVKALVARSDCQLLHLDIRHCPNISKDAVDLARKKEGLKVSSSDVMPNHRAKKVRYE
ncbi:MAG: hypothetical protein Q9206_006825 [Seirophora lacunosa]